MLIYVYYSCFEKQGLMRPELLGSDFTHLEFIRRPVRKDLGKKLLYRDAYMSGWSYKTVTMDDLKFPLVYGEGKRVSILFLFVFFFRLHSV